MTTISAPTSVPTEIAHVVDRVRKFAEVEAVPGMELAVVRDRKPFYAGGFGLARVESQVPVGPRTLFHHGSCGKAFTALLALVLAEDGVLDLDAPVRTYVPELRLPDAVIAERATIRDLLSHRSGLARHDHAWIYNPSWSREEMVAKLAQLSLVGDIRAQWSYSNFGYALAGLAIGRATNSTWEEQLQTRLFDAVGLTRSFTDFDRVIADPGSAQPYAVRDGVAVPTQWRRMPAAQPAGGIMTCADDSIKWLLLQLGEGPIAADLVRKSHQLHAAMPADASPYPELKLWGYGLGWGIGSYRGREIIWHTGGVDGFFTYVALLPDEGIGVASSANTLNTQLPFGMALDIFDALLGESNEVSWCERLRATEEEAKAKAAEAKAAAPEPRPATPAPPTHALNVYVGTFEHSGYGELTVALVDGSLTFVVGETPMVATHRHYDTWDLHYDPLDADAPATFVTDADGRVSRVEVEFEEGAASITYRCRPEESAST